MHTFETTKNLLSLLNHSVPFVFPSVEMAAILKLTYVVKILSNIKFNMYYRYALRADTQIYMGMGIFTARVINAG